MCTKNFEIACKSINLVENYLSKQNQLFMDFNTMHKQRKFVLIAAALGLISCFLPWFKASFMGISAASANALDGTGGIIVLIGFGVAGVLAFLGDQKTTMSKTAWLGVLGAGALAALIIVINILNKGGAKGEMKSYVKFGIGIFIALAAVAGVLASAYMFRGAGQDLKQSLNEMKKSVENKLDGDPNT
jgi:predicted small secreted protein